MQGRGNRSLYGTGICEEDGDWKVWKGTTGLLRVAGGKRDGFIGESDRKTENIDRKTGRNRRRN